MNFGAKVLLFFEIRKHKLAEYLPFLQKPSSEPHQNPFSHTISANKFAYIAKKLYLCSRKLQRVSYMDFKILNFTIFCVNNVASYLNKSAKDVYHAMQNAGMIDGYIVPCYDVLHSFSKEYIVDDLVSLMRQKGVQL